MKDVFLWAWHRTQLKTSKIHSMETWPLFRRMTALQKAVLIAFTELSTNFPDAGLEARNLCAPLFLTSAYGELSPMLRITQAILNHDLPISPVDFQHSVLNAALSYLAMSQNYHQAGYALSGGFAGPDSTLHLAAQRIKSGLEQASILIHAHEHFGSNGDAEAEILILSRNQPAQGGFRLEHSLWTQFGVAETLAGGSLRAYGSDQQDGLIPWLIEADRPVPRRFVSQTQEQGWVTIWKAC